MAGLFLLMVERAGRVERRCDGILGKISIAVVSVTPITSAGATMWDLERVQQQGHVMGHFRKAVIAARILMLAGMSAATPAAAATFDGEWNVQIASTSSACGGGASVSIGINNGQVASTNAMMSASGRVAEAGNIVVTLVSGIKRATGFGHLSASSGSGTWRGALCSGTWTAQRI
jgi:hypothetical protein